MTTIDLSGAQWRKSRHSGSEGNCVEVGQTPARVVAVRDTQDRGGPVLTVSPAAWRAFMAAVRQSRAVRSLNQP